MRWVSRMREGLRGLVLKSREDAETDEEMRFHVDMETERLVRDAGLDPREARRQALVAFGGVERHREAVRDARGLAWVGGLSLDLKLGARMLVKYPGLSLVGGLGMAVAIAIGAGFFAMTYSYVMPTLPLDEGDRLVGIESRDAAANHTERRVLHDFVAWREELRSVEELGAFHTVRRNLISAEGAAELVHVAEMTASGFRAARVPPLLGRHLMEADEQAGAAPVVVIGYDVWQTRYEGDPGVIGSTLQLGETRYTVVGVMPEGYAFPISHSFWTPLRADPSDYALRQGPAIRIFGRLAPGVTREEAQAELTTLGQRTAAAQPTTHEHLRPGIVPFTSAFGAISGGEMPWMLHLMQLLVSMLLVVVAVNVAILVYARTATRMGEIAVRSALGASRRRIVAQLFLEALALSGVAAVLGLVIARLAVRRLDALIQDAAASYGGLPFWIDGGLSLGTAFYVLGLAVLAAAIIGIVPGLKATGRGLQSRLREVGGGTGMRMGRTWTVLVVAQVASAVAVLPAVVILGLDWARDGLAGPGLAAERYLTAVIEMDRETPPSAEAEAYQRAFGARYADRLAELVARLEAEPGAGAVTVASAVPGQEPGALIEVDGAPAPAGAAGHTARYLRVGSGFLDAFDVSLSSGRRLAPGDAGIGATAILVNQSFAREVLGGAAGLGRRLRYVVAEAGETPGALEIGAWHEIVGVVDDLPSTSDHPRIYHAMTPGQVYPTTLAVRTEGATPASLAPRLRAVIAALDPALRPHEVYPLDELYRGGEEGMMRVGAVAVVLLTLSVLLLSAAGLYALMSFTIARRRREIGIRAALGAHPHRILTSVFSRALGQLALGVAIGALLAVPLAGVTMEPDVPIGVPVVVSLVAATVLAVGLLAAVGPARRGLRVQPTEALRAE